MGSIGSPNSSKLKNWMAMDYADAYDTVFDYKSIHQKQNPELDSPYSRAPFNAAVDMLELNEKPVILDDKEFDMSFTDNSLDGVLLYRGVKKEGRRKKDLTGEQIIDQLKYGDTTRVGLGIYGEGIYFTTEKEEAKGYSEGTSGSLATAYIDKKKAKVIDYYRLKKMMQNDPYYKKRNQTSFFGSDYSIYALHKGYNVIRVYGANSKVHDPKSSAISYGGQDFYLPLTRRVLVIKKK